jgi:hypothetical protein
MNSSPKSAATPWPAAAAKRSYTPKSWKLEEPITRTFSRAAVSTASSTVSKAEKLGGKWTWVLKAGRSSTGRRPFLVRLIIRPESSHPVGSAARRHPAAYPDQPESGWAPVSDAVLIWSS